MLSLRWKDTQHLPLHKHRIPHKEKGVGCSWKCFPEEWHYYVECGRISQFVQMTKWASKLFFSCTISFCPWESLYDVSLRLRLNLVGHVHFCAQVHYEPSALLLAHLQWSWGRREDVPARKRSVSQKSPLNMLTRQLHPQLISQHVQNAPKGSVHQVSPSAKESPAVLLLQEFEIKLTTVWG